VPFIHDNKKSLNSGSFVCFNPGMNNTYWLELYDLIENEMIGQLCAFPYMSIADQFQLTMFL
jgi:hypothetical protein